MNPGADLDRVLVVGTSGCGKSTFARALAQRLDRSHTELDALFWLPDWEMRLPSDFRARVTEVTEGPRWIIDGNYSTVRDLTWARATRVIWLDYSLPRVFLQALRRTMRRVSTRETLFAGNREDFRRAFLSTDSILVWVLKTYHRRRRELLRLGAEPGAPPILRFRNPRETRRWLLGLAGPTPLHKKESLK